MYVNIYVILWGINIVMVIVIFVLGCMVVGVIILMIGKIMLKLKYDFMLVDFLKLILNVILMLFVIVVLLDQLGVDIILLVVILGVVGLVIGLLFQDLLKNFVVGVMLLVFKLFCLGDFIEVGGIVGVVKKIGIFILMMNIFDNKEIIVLNGKIYGDNIVNYLVMDMCCVDMIFGIGYGDDLLKVKNFFE